MNKPFFKEIEDYFENEIVGKTKHIGTFVPMAATALDNALAKSKSDSDPFLVLMSYEGKPNENDQRTIITRTLTFSILFRCKTDDNTLQRKAIDNAEHIGLNVISKLKYDADCAKVDWLKKAFHKESVHFTEASYEYYPAMFGMEFSFDLEIKNPIHYNADFWEL